MPYTSPAWVNNSTPALNATNLLDLSRAASAGYSFYNVKHPTYGAAGDGSTDDSAEIQAAIDAAGAATDDGVVFLPPGTYNVGTTRLLIPTGVHLRGAGIGLTTIASTGAAGVVGTTQSGTTKTVYADISVSDLTITNVAQAGAAFNNITRVTVRNVAVSVTTGNHMGLLFQYCDHVAVSGCFIGPTTGNGININACDHAAVVGNTVETTGDDGIDIDIDYLGAAATKSKWVTVSANIVETVSGGNGIRVENSDYVAVTGNVVDGASAAGIHVNTTAGFSCDDVTVTGNVCVNCATHGISAYQEGGGNSLDAVVISGNSVDTCATGASGTTRGGIFVATGCDRPLVSGNKVRSSGNSAGGDGGGILLYKVNDVAVLGNYVSDCTNVAVSFWNGDAATTYTGITVANNVLDNNTADFGGGSGVQNQTGITYRNNTSDATLDIASAATIALPGHSDYFNITGTTTITSVTASCAGRRVTLKFAGALTFTDGSNLILNTASGSFSTSADDTITLVCNGTNWYEVSRSAN